MSHEFDLTACDFVLTPYEKIFSRFFPPPCRRCKNIGARALTHMATVNFTHAGRAILFNALKSIRGAIPNEVKYYNVLTVCLTRQ